MATMRVAQVSRPGGPLELGERPIPDPGSGSVRIKVQAAAPVTATSLPRRANGPASPSRASQGTR